MFLAVTIALLWMTASQAQNNQRCCSPSYAVDSAYYAPLNLWERLYYNSVTGKYLHVMVNPGGEIYSEKLIDSATGRTYTRKLDGCSSRRNPNGVLVGGCIPEGATFVGVLDVGPEKIYKWRRNEVEVEDDYMYSYVDARCLFRTVVEEDWLPPHFHQDYTFNTSADVSIIESFDTIDCVPV